MWCYMCILSSHFAQICTDGVVADLRCNVKQESRKAKSLPFIQAVCSMEELESIISTSTYIRQRKCCTFAWSARSHPAVNPGEEETMQGFKSVGHQGREEEGICSCTCIKGNMYDSAKPKIGTMISSKRTPSFPPPIAHCPRI